MAPTFVAKYGPASNDNATSPKTAATTTTAGDLLVVACIAENAASGFTVSGGSLTWTKTITSGVVSGRGYIEVWTATDASGVSPTVSVAYNGTTFFGFVVERWSGAALGNNTTNQSTATWAGSITTANANSAVFNAAIDWSGSTGAETWATVNSITPTAANGGESLHFSDSAHYTLYAAHWTNVGAAGTYGCLVSAPSPGGFTIASLEIKAGGAAGPTAQAPRPRLWIPQLIAADRAARW